MTPSVTGLRIDPTRTVSLRKRFAAEYKRRFTYLLQDIRPHIVSTASRHEAVETFHHLITDAVRHRFLGPDAQGQPWYQEFLDSATERGILRGYNQVKPELLSQPDFLGGTSYQFVRTVMGQYSDNRRLLENRIRRDVKAIAEDTIHKVVREYRHSFGDWPMAWTDIKDALKGVINSRAVPLAYHETVSRFVEGQLDAYEELDIESVGLIVEFVTAGDLHVCPTCNAFAGDHMSIEEARGLLPLHVRCRCAFSPVRD